MSNSKDNPIHQNEDSGYAQGVHFDRSPNFTLEYQIYGVSESATRTPIRTQKI